LLVTDNVVPSSQILLILIMMALRYLQEPQGVTFQKTAFFTRKYVLDSETATEMDKVQKLCDSS
jgi:hypothetical protein